MKEVGKVIRRKIGIILAVIMTVTMLPAGASAAASKTATPSGISCYVSADGDLSFKWSAVSGADKYTLVLENRTKKTSMTFTTGNTYKEIEDISVLTHGCSFTACVTALDSSAKKSASSAKYLSSSVRFVDPSKLYISNPKLTINKGKKRKLRATFDTGSLDVYSYNSKLLGRWSSSNSSVASVSQAGNVKAVSAGKATVTYRTIDGLSVSSEITVPSGNTKTGSAYISNGYHASWHRVLGSQTMRKGSQNRLNGKIYSDYKIKRIYVRVYSTSGKRQSAYTKYTSSYSYDLTKLSKNVPFGKLSKGTKIIKVMIKNSKGTFTLYTDKFKVTSKPSYSKRGAKIVEMALTRQGDPYSQWLRGLSNYADCSYLTLWSYKHAAGRTLPATAADQYKYCVKKERKSARPIEKPEIWYSGAERKTADIKAYGIQLYIWAII